MIGRTWATRTTAVARVAAAAALGAAACAADGIEVAVVPGDSPTFEWEDGPVDALTVYRCQSDCDQTRCGRVVPFDGGGVAVWNYGDYDYDEVAPAVASPVTYGASGDAATDAEAEALLDNALYAVEVERLGTCNERGTCTILASGCAVFEP